MRSSLTNFSATFGTCARIGAVALSVSFFSACASSGTNTSGQLVDDPLEPWNRYVFAVNDVVYMFAQPFIAPYMVLPDGGKKAVDSALNNLGTPVTLANDVLQGEFSRAWVTTQRFFINTTVGLLGFIDVAEDMGLPRHNEDFGQTLGTYGVADGPYLVLPLLGPSNPRDAVGAGVDAVTQPLFWVPANHIGDAINGALAYSNFANQYGSRAPQMEALRKTSLDYYATIRSLYTQNRRALVKNEDGKAGTLIDYFPEDSAPATPNTP